MSYKQTSEKCYFIIFNFFIAFFDITDGKKYLDLDKNIIQS